MNTVVKTRYGEVRGSVADGVHTCATAQQVREHLASTWFHKLDGRRGLDWGVCGRLWSRLGA
jgi:hypothetical protein